MISGPTQDILPEEWKETSMLQFPGRTQKDFKTFAPNFVPTKRLVLQKIPTFSILIKQL